MGNSKNMNWSHKCRGKYVKRVVPKTKNSNKHSLNSSRIINLEKLKEYLQVVSQHAATCQACADNALSGNDAIILSGEKKKNGLCSVLTSHCAGCLMEFNFSTSPKRKGISGGLYWECNLAAVWGQMATGGGHAPLTESMAVLGVPSLTKKAFISIEKRIGEWWWALFEDSMKEAGNEERSIAIANGRYHQGVPAITVIIDGGWSKRSHKHSYNAKSGVGIIIGKETKKILYLGVRNKYCSACNKAAGGIPPKHDCFKNWSESSSAMETDIILKRFLTSEQQHGLRYIEFIGDGDSSVFPTLVSGVSYGPYIKKLECANHAVKCYRTALENLVHDKPSYKGKGKLTEAMRKKLTKAARSAIIMRSQEADKVTAVKKLQHDLLNSPLHCFGIHSKCSPNFCRTQQQVQQPQQQTPPQQQQHQIQEQQIHEQQQIQQQQQQQQVIEHQIHEYNNKYNNIKYKNSKYTNSSKYNIKYKNSSK